MDKKLKIILIGIGIAFVGFLIGTLFDKEQVPFGSYLNLEEPNATSTTLVAGNPRVVMTDNWSRQWATLTNKSATIAYLALASTTAPNINNIAEKYFVIPLAANGGTYVIDETNLYKGQVVATSNAAVTIDVLDK